MSRPRFLADEDFDEHIVLGVLRQEPSIEFQRVHELGMRELSDQEILAFAASELLLVVSHDTNTMSAAAYHRVKSGESMPGLLLAEQIAPIGPVIESLVLIWAASEMDEWKDQVRYLPLK